MQQRLSFFDFSFNDVFFKICKILLLPMTSKLNFTKDGGMLF